MRTQRRSGETMGVTLPLYDDVTVPIFGLNWIGPPSTSSVGGGRFSACCLLSRRALASRKPSSSLRASASRSSRGRLTAASSSSLLLRTKASALSGSEGPTARASARVFSISDLASTVPFWFCRWNFFSRSVS